MRLFKEGDKLELQRNYGGFGKGEVVEVIHVDSDDEMLPYLCETDGLAIWCPEGILKLVEPVGKQSHDGKVTEAHRIAEPGEYIKITAPCITSECYEKGDILKVFERWPFGVYAFTKYKNPDHSNNTDKPTSWISDDEYVVLEGYKSEKHSKSGQKAKAGDTIRVLRDNGGVVKAGTVWKVKEVRPDGALSITNEKIGGGLTWGCDPCNYVVLHSGKHVYSEAEISEAKKICKDIILELFDKGVSCVFYVAKELGNGQTMADLEMGIPHGSARGFAHCSSSDEFNEWIGRCVALCKAAHKPIPVFVMGESGNHSHHFDYEKAKYLTSCPDYDAVIHVKNKDERTELMKEFEKLGFRWFSGCEPMENQPSLSAFDGCFGVHGKRFGYNAPDNCKKYVEFSDCFTED